MAKRRARKASPARKASRAKPRAKKTAKAAKTARATNAKRSRRAVKAARAPEVNAAAKARRERSLQAIRRYERGLDAMQRKDFVAAEKALREVLGDYPEERELHERARLYVKICERESAPPAPAPQSVEERAFAATLALNAGAVDEALRHLDAAASEEPDSAHVQYMLAVARALAGEPAPAVAHLERAVALNPDNRVLARQEPDFEALWGDAAFRRAIARSERPRKRS